MHQKGRKSINKTSKSICLKCKTEKAVTNANFYSNTHPLFTSERLEICKSCISDYLGVKDSKNYLSRIYTILALLDRPFITSLWERTNGEWTKYVPQLSSLPQYKGLTFADSDFFNSNSSTQETSVADSKMRNEEKIYSDKWMGEYTRSDIEYLEEYYTGLDRDFKIITTNHKDYAKKICKASLHMDRMFQDVLSGVAGADKKYKDAKEVFDSLSKSAQFAESGRGQNDVSLGGFGVVFDQVETSTWIPKHDPLGKDEIDQLLEQFGSIRESV